jgi:hypothetical protein
MDSNNLNECMRQAEYGEDDEGIPVDSFGEFLFLRERILNRMHSIISGQRRCFKTIDVREFRCSSDITSSSTESYLQTIKLTGMN